MLSNRHELAQLCGYPTFAHRAMVESLGETPEKVDAFLKKLSKELRPRVNRDYDTMLTLKKKNNPSCTSLEMWDVPYFTTQAKNNFFQVHISSRNFITIKQANCNCGSRKLLIWPTKVKMLCFKVVFLMNAPSEWVKTYRFGPWVSPKIISDPLYLSCAPLLQSESF